MTWTDLIAAAPEAILVLTACAVLLQDAWATEGVLEAERGAATTWLALAGVCLAGVAAVAVAPSEPVAFGGMYVRDGITRLADLIALGTAGVGVLLADAYVRRTRLPAGEYYAIALDYVDLGEMNDPEFLDRIKDRATVFTLDDGGTKVLDLKISSPSS